MRVEGAPREIRVKGLSLVCQSDPAAPLTAFRLCLDAGSRYDPAGRQGLAHLCEHLLCQGGWNGGPDLQEAIGVAGGSTNGWVFPDRMCFGESLPPGAVDLGLLIAARRLAPDLRALSADRLGRERQVLLQERREREAVPLVVEVEALHRLLFPPGHPYRSAPGGVAEEIAGLTRDDVEAFTATHVSSEQAVLAVVGAIEPEAVAQRLEGLLDESVAGRPPPGAASMPDGAVEPRADLVTRVPYVRAYLAVRTAGFGSVDGLAAAVVARSIAAGRSSPLRRSLVNAIPRIESVRAYVEEYQKASVVAFVATAAGSADAAVLADALAAGVDRLLAGELTRADLERGRKMLRIESFNALARPSLRADRLACRRLFTGEAGELDTDDLALRDLEPEALLRWARRAWAPAGRVVLTVRPEARRR